MKEFIKKNSFLLLMVASFIFWFICFDVFWRFRARLFDDGFSYYNIVKYYLENISRGQIQMWNPFMNWGMPDGLNLRFLGEYNPYLLLPLILFKAGFSYIFVYFSYAISYFFLGVYGFYLICYRLTKDKKLSFFAFLLLLFSSSGINLFFNYCEILIWVPAIWFFYFLVRFYQKNSARDFLGITFCAMLILITYMPFYFLTVFIVFLLGFVILYFKESCNFIRRILGFVNENKGIAILCLASVLIAAIPGFLWFWEAGKGEYVYNYRQAGEAGINNAAVVSKGMVTVGGLIGPLYFKSLFSGLSFVRNQLSYFFLSIFIYPIILLAAFNRVTKKAFLYLFVTLIMFLISLPGEIPLHGFLYDHVGYFKYIRNIYYLLHLAIPFLILFIVEQIKALLSVRVDKIARKLVLSLVIAVHLGFIYFLHSFGNIITTSYLTVILSAIFFLLYFSGMIKRKGLAVFVIFTLLIVMQPIEVFKSYSRNFSGDKITYVTIKKKPKFYYLRSEMNSEFKYRYDFYIDATGLDGGRMAYKYEGLKASRMLLMNVDAERLFNYVENKFVVYDKVLEIDENNINWSAIENNFAKLNNEAFVFNKDNDAVRTSIPINPQAQVISASSQQFEVLKFDLNYIEFKTNFAKDKFIVYNDNFHSQWKGFVDGKMIKMAQANIAFKGLWVPAGTHIVRFEYGRYWEYFIHWFVLVYFLLFFFVFVRIGIKHEKNI